MKKTLILIAAIAFSAIESYAQSAKEMQAEIKGAYTLDDNGNVTYTKVIEAPGLSKEDIFSRAQNYFTYNYGSGKSVIQTEDKDRGLLVGKGIYVNVHVGVSLVSVAVDAWHILRIDVKDGRARAVITLTQYDKTITGGNTPPVNRTTFISQEYPINPKGDSKTIMMKAFYKSHHAALNTLNKLEKAILEGTTSSAIENADW